MEQEKFNKQEFIDSLTEKKATNPCHRCGNRKFTMIDGYSFFPIRDELDKQFSNGPNVPAVLVICTKCGAVTAHAIGAFRPIRKLGGREVSNG